MKQRFGTCSTQTPNQSNSQAEGTSRQGISGSRQEPTQDSRQEITKTRGKIKTGKN